MHTWESAAYFHEVAFQCQFAVEAFAGVERELAAMKETRRQLLALDTSRETATLLATSADRRNHVARVFYYLQSFLVATANVSKLLWPNVHGGRRPDTVTPSEWRAELALRRDRANARAAELRNMLQVPDIADDSPLGARDLRNKFEHFDEMLDEALRHSTIIADMSINIVGQIQSDMPVTYLRNFDSDNYIVTFTGLDPLPLRPMLHELRRLLGLASNLANGGRGVWLW
jgi:hypothetical protein